MECIYLKKAEYLGDYRIHVEFNDGKSGPVDLRDTIEKYKQAEPLRDKKLFSQFYLDAWPTLAWECGFDIAPESLYEKCGQGVATEPHVAAVPGGE